MREFSVREVAGRSQLHRAHSSPGYNPPISRPARNNVLISTS